MTRRRTNKAGLKSLVNRTITSIAADVAEMHCIRYANGVHLSAIWENTAHVQCIRCEPLGEHLIH